MTEQLVGLKSSLRKDGTRDWVHPADVKGRFTTLRRLGFTLLIGVYVILPWVPVGGHPALFLDVPARRFYLFGLTFNAEDAWMLFFVVTGVGFSLIVLAAMLGRVWCGYACPQTVFLEGVFRRIERLIEGPRNARIKRNSAPMSFDKFWRKALKHLIFLMIASLLAHVLISYFTSLPALFEMVLKAPSQHPEPFVWATSVTALLYLNFAFFREQLCLIVCPYGRLQSALMDKHSLIVGYDVARGEPRGKKSDPEAGDCVSCNRCVVVCPTGIDIRNGLQLDCIGCANCIDACDEVMAKVGREKGLIRYDSLAGLDGLARKFLRPRVFFYAFLGLVGLTVMSLSLSQRQPFGATMLRLSGSPFTRVEGGIRNGFEVHLTNKDSHDNRWELRPLNEMPVEFVMPVREVELGAFESRRIPVFVTVPESEMNDDLLARLQVVPLSGRGEPVTVEARILGPVRRRSSTTSE